MMQILALISGTKVGHGDRSEEGGEEDHEEDSEKGHERDDEQI